MLPSRVTGVCLVLGLAGFLCGCEDILDFDVERDIDEQHIAGSPLGPLVGDLIEFPLMIDLENEISRRNAGPAAAVRLTELSFSITPTDTPAGDSDDFDFLARIRLNVESTRAGTSLTPMLIAQLNPVPDGQTTIDLDTIESVNLKPYVEEGCRITSEAEGTAPPDDVSFDGHLTLLIETL